jgi:hypothetical protein
MKYRKKPLIIEAFRMTRERRDDNREWPTWLVLAWNKDRNEKGALYPSDNPADPPHSIRVRTLEGDILVSWGDWIIRGVKGELYPCKPDIFRATFEPVEVLSTDAQKNPRKANLEHAVMSAVLFANEYVEDGEGLYWTCEWVDGHDRSLSRAHQVAFHAYLTKQPVLELAAAAAVWYAKFSGGSPSPTASCESRALTCVARLLDLVRET